MLKRLAMLMATLGLAACQVAPVQGAASFCDSDARSAVLAMVQAHGGMGAWQGLQTLYVEREHLFAGTEQAIRFNILGEYASNRIYQTRRE